MSKKATQSSGAKKATQSSAKTTTKKAATKKTSSAPANVEKKANERDALGAVKTSHLACVNEALQSFGANFATMKAIVAKAKEIGAKRQVEIKHSTYYDHCNRLFAKGALERANDKETNKRVYRVAQK